jgi:chromate reductase, NAD(P)H dehydrogenase (quinone)
MPNILAISGSLRLRSYNTLLLRAMIEAAPAGTTIELASIKDVPLYDADVDAATGPPPSVKALKAKLSAADALLLSSPEYNHSIPGVLKNTIDWMSRPAPEIPQLFGGRAVGIVGATTGQGGTLLAQAAWLPVFEALGLIPFFRVRVTVSGAARVFDEQGHIQDAAIRERLEKYMTGFAQFVTAVRPRA